MKDGQGYFITCDCKREIKPCDRNCCGNGDCKDSVGVCTNCGNPAWAPDADCCPTINVTDICYNDGLYCSGNGRCDTNVCICNSDADGPLFTGVACNVSVPRTKKCSALPATDCQSCLDAAAANGIYCGWCTGEDIGSSASLTSGVCTEDSNCAAGAGSNYTQLSACLIVTTWVPEPCPDNCSGNGKCENKTVVDPNNSSNVTNASACACFDKYSGDNCAVVPVDVVLISSITAGAIAGIVIAVIAFLAIAGGGAYAAAQAMATGGAAPVVNNPLYRGDGNQGVNPLYKA